MPFKKGQSGNPAGKPKGAKNKFTTLKNAFINAFNRIGGEDTLAEWADVGKNIKDKKNLKDFFRMLAGMLPSHIDAKIDGTIDTTRYKDLKLNDLIKLAKKAGIPVGTRLERFFKHKK